MRFWMGAGLVAGGALGGAALYHYLRSAQTTTVVVAHPTTGAAISLPVPSSVAAAQALPCIDNCAPQAAWTPQCPPGATLVTAGGVTRCADAVGNTVSPTNVPASSMTINGRRY